MKIVVASENPVKINAARQGFERMFPAADIQVSGVKTASGVSEQPFSDEETRRGAHNRIDELVQTQRADYYVSSEGGVEEQNDVLFAFAWNVIRSSDGREGVARSASFAHPDVLARRVRDGEEVGIAADHVFGEQNAKQKGGALGLLSGGVIDRTELYMQPVILALLPLVNREMYEQ